MEMACLIMGGKFYEEGRPVIIALNKSIAVRWLRSQGYRKSRDKWNADLFEKKTDGASVWARIDPIFVVEA